MITLSFKVLGWRLVSIEVDPEGLINALDPATTTEATARRRPTERVVNNMSRRWVTKMLA
jgi:hypothetical protein